MAPWNTEGTGGNALKEESLGSRIRARRQELHLTQEELANKVGLTQRAINQIEVGILNKKFMADYLPLIAAELQTTMEALQNGELHSGKATLELLKRMRKAGTIRSDHELEKVHDLATQLIRKRSNANIPLNEYEILNLIEVMRGADGY